MIYGIFFVLHWALALLLTWRLMAKKKSIGESLGWLFVIYAVPVIGAILYFALGERRQGDKRVRRLDTLSEYVNRWQADLASSQRPESNPTGTCPDGKLENQLASFVEETTGYPVVRIGKSKLLNRFDEVLPEMVRIIDGAQNFLHLEFYIWEPHARIAQVQAALLQARKRGVTVRILVDSIGSGAFLDSSEFQALGSAGCELEVSMKLSLIGGRWDLRNHRKILIADGQVALSGSMNMGDPDYFKQDAGVGKWVDAMMRVDGAGAQSLNGVFLQDWWVERGISTTEKDHWDYGDFATLEPNSVTQAIQVLPSGPGVFPDAIHQVLMMAIYGANHGLVLTTPYFVPDESIQKALIAAALRGVSVRLIVPKKSDFRVASLAGASNYQELLDAGVQIGLFQGGLLHTKCLTVDGRVSIFGTVNLDMRSLWLNLEVSMLIYDSTCTAELEGLLQGYWENCEELDGERWKQRPLLQRSMEAAARLLGPVI